MRVKGTVFAVTAAGGTVLSVLRGSVEAEGTDGGRVMVRADQTTRISDGAMARMTEQERDWMWAGVRVMDLVDAARAGHLDIDSRPSGAEVWVDDALLGRTPLVARIREGQRMLSLRMDGYQRVTEYLEVLDGMSQNRVFVLEGAGPVVVEQKKDGPATVPVNPAALLAAAQKYRIHRQWQKAADAYAEILALAPGSPQAEAALVSLGKLELTRLSRPASALRHFDAYLKRGGALSQEALYGRATAFRALGRTEEEIRVLKAFIAAYPDAIEVDTASRRLAALTTPRHP